MVAVTAPLLLPRTRGARRRIFRRALPLREPLLPAPLAIRGRQKAKAGRVPILCRTRVRMYFGNSGPIDPQLSLSEFVWLPRGAPPHYTSVIFYAPKLCFSSPDPENRHKPYSVRSDSLMYEVPAKACTILSALYLRGWKPSFRHVQFYLYWHSWNWMHWHVRSQVSGMPGF